MEDNHSPRLTIQKKLGLTHHLNFALLLLDLSVSLGTKSDPIPRCLGKYRDHFGLHHIRRYRAYIFYWVYKTQ